MIEKEQIQANVEEWTSTIIGEEFEFRKYQKEQIVDIIYNIVNNINETHIIEAPTGSGKSLLNIISAGVLADYYNMSSYILVSDLFLWKQYEDFLKTHRYINRKFGLIKGQTGNYKCSKNNEDMRNADCRMAGLSWTKMFNSADADEFGYNCARTCPYIKARKKALMSKVVIMTYQLYHYMINVVQKTHPSSKFSFKGRDVLFCDECHNIPTIVKNCFAPEIKYSDYNMFSTIYNYKRNKQRDLFEFENTELDVDENDAPIQRKQLIDYYANEQELKDEFNKIWKTVSDSHSNSVTIAKGLNAYLDLMHKCINTVETIEQDMQYKRQILRKRFDKEDVKYYKSASAFRNCMCLWSDFNDCLSVTGEGYIIREISESRLLKENVVTLSNVKEDYICYYFLLSTAPHIVLMSATIGGFEAYTENIGTKYVIENSQNEDEEVLFDIIPSTFDFSKSPILYLNRHKMSFRFKEQSLQALKPIIYRICANNFANERGMIQTGSYANAKEIYDNAPENIKQRMLLYNNSKEKTQMITIHQMSRNTILVGPTLVDGIDLPGSQCRFIVILKVPYPVIVDEYVKRKNELFPLWYLSSTSNTIIQGIGRGNRFTDDYCTTYILDACFLSLYNSTKSQYPKEIQNRLRIYN